MTIFPQSVRNWTQVRVRTIKSAKCCIASTEFDLQFLTLCCLFFNQLAAQKRGGRITRNTKIELYTMDRKLALFKQIRELTRDDHELPMVISGFQIDRLLCGWIGMLPDSTPEALRARLAAGDPKVVKLHGLITQARFLNIRVENWIDEQK